MSDPSSPDPSRSLSARFFGGWVGESLFFSWANSPRATSRLHFFLGAPLRSDFSGTPLVRARPISPGPQSGPSRSRDGPQPSCAGPHFTFYAVLAARVCGLRFTGSAPPGGPSTVRGAKRSHLCSRFDARPPLLLAQLHRKVGPLPPASPGLPRSFFSPLTLGRQGPVWAAKPPLVNRGVQRQWPEGTPRAPRTRSTR
ncbi:hypothetical protein NDU88_008193 [Pleurodeles waltl]|uniref:Uncharacterized protein n=1 Tax=Pleurodeles waltl TaxID=8319 RepID=A0AAV7NYI0_PLEWA|nr:hypothetical protein NDU88_008193 [Pleurodeles waltl]